MILNKKKKSNSLNLNAYFVYSVVGVSASHDRNAFKYNMCWRLQGPKVEIIQDFKNIVVQHLMVFKEENGDFPAVILYYRDGVSEGQFDQVMAIERNAMVRINEHDFISKKLFITLNLPCILGCCMP